MEEFFGIQRQLGRRNDNPDLAKFGYNNNTVRIQTDVYFSTGNIQGKYNKINSWIEVSDETVSKPKIINWIKWFLKHSHSFVPSPISDWGGLKFQKKWVKGQLILGVISLSLAIIVTDTAIAF